MNKIDLLNTAGFPLDTNTLDFLQKAYNELQAMTAFGGNNVIVSGCIVAGANTSDGVVIINGELLPFVGGLSQAKVVVKEDVTPMEFENGAQHDVYRMRYATFGNALPNVLFADLTRLTDIKTLTALIAKVDALEKKVAPFNSGSGGRVLWNKPANLIPDGWVEDTDFRGRMPVGLDEAIAQFDTMGETGGSRTHQNSIEEMVPHTHPFNDTKPNNALDFGNGSTRPAYTAITSEDKYTGSTGGEFGVAKPYDIMNPYRIVLFIKYIG